MNKDELIAGLKTWVNDHPRKTAIIVGALFFFALGAWFF